MKQKPRSSLNKEINKEEKTSVYNNTFDVDISTLNFLIQYLIDNFNNIDESDLNNLINGIDFKLINSLSKHQIRNFWIYQIRHHNLFCEICGNHIDIINGYSKNRLTLDHRIPKSKGGKTNFSNSGPAHSICNSLKTNIMPKKWERIGLKILSDYGIIINKQHTKYNYHER